MSGRDDRMRTLCWLCWLLSLIACTESRDAEDGTAGKAAEAGRPAAGSGGAGTTSAAQGGAGAPATAGKAAAGSTSTPDKCVKLNQEADALINANLKCTRDSECVVVGSCSGGFGFKVAHESVAKQAQALSDATPRECASFDGPMFEPVCKGVDRGTGTPGK